MKRPGTFGLLTLLAVAGCEKDPLSRGDESTYTEATPVEGGGATGGPIDGWVTFFLLDEAGAPIQGAIVLAGAHRGTSDETGEVELTIDAGPIDAHIFAAGYVPLSIAGVDHRSVTLHLFDGAFDLNLDQREPEVARVSGAVTGWERLPPLVTTSSTIQSERFAEIMPAATGGYFGFVEQEVRNEAGWPTNYAIGGAWEDYAIKVDAQSTRALYAVGGRSEYDFAIDEGQRLVTHLGVLLDLDLSEGETLEGRNIDLTFPLEPMNLDLRGVPTDLPNADVMLSLRLPRDNGELYLDHAGTESGASIFEVGAPRLEGLIADGSYVADVFLSGPDASSNLRLAATDRTMVIDGFLLPPQTINQSGRRIEVTYAARTGYRSVSISKEVEVEIGGPDDPPGAEVQSTAIWTILDLSGGDTMTIELPEPPIALETPLAEATEIRASQIDADFDPALISFNDIASDDSFASRSARAAF